MEGGRKSEEKEGRELIRCTRGKSPGNMTDKGKGHTGQETLKVPV